MGGFSIITITITIIIIIIVIIVIIIIVTIVIKRYVLTIVKVIGTAQCVLHFASGYTSSWQRQLDFSGKHSGKLQLLREDCSFTYPPLSVARYPFIQLSDLRQRGMNEIAKVSKWQEEIRTRVLLSTL